PSPRLEVSAHLGGEQQEATVCSSSFLDVPALEPPSAFRDRGPEYANGPWEDPTSQATESGGVHRPGGVAPEGGRRVGALGPRRLPSAFAPWTPSPGAVPRSRMVGDADRAGGPSGWRGTQGGEEASGSAGSPFGHMGEASGPEGSEDEALSEGRSEACLLGLATRQSMVTGGPGLQVAGPAGSLPQAGLHARETVVRGDGWSPRAPGGGEDEALRVGPGANAKKGPSAKHLKHGLTGLRTGLTPKSWPWGGSE
ncbi:hypothetical protein chiPu_0025740, partial [Chiloscyllium punctatum]|nr:hypothetical protein [Chiloscyllium punctatum]